MGTGRINSQRFYWEAGSTRDDRSPVFTSVHAPEQSIGRPRIDHARVPGVNHDGIRRNSGSGEPQVNRRPAPSAVRAFEQAIVRPSLLNRGRPVLNVGCVYIVLGQPTIGRLLLPLGRTALGTPLRL